MRHTKIVATLGPASAGEPELEQLVAAGVDVFRLNFSHGTHEDHAALFARARAAAARAGRIVAIMQDLSGPKIRTGPLAGGGPIPLRRGDRLAIATGDFAGGPGRVSTTYAGLAQSVLPGDRLLLDDGRIELRVEGSDGAEIVTTVVDGGPLGAHKGINAPGVALPASAMTAKDAEDLRFGLELGVDMVAVSFVQSAADLQRARELMGRATGTQRPLVAKIERPAGITNLDEILAACDAVMVARGDLGLELPLERVPRVQKEITKRARRHGIPVIVATQVFESMRTEPRPTRAEVSDAANAVDDGVDAIMLAGETAIGSHPARAVHTLDVVIRDAEAMLQPAGPAAAAVPDAAGHGPALCEAAVTLAAEGRADAIVAVTREGRTARLLSALRPLAPVYAATNSEQIARWLALTWGVVPLVTEIRDDVDTTGAAIQEHLLARGILPPGSVVVYVSIDPDLDQSGANFLSLRRLGG
jgi:pyruvate kinase